MVLPPPPETEVANENITVFLSLLTHKKGNCTIGKTLIFHFEISNFLFLRGRAKLTYWNGKTIMVKTTVFGGYIVFFAA